MPKRTGTIIDILEALLIGMPPFFISEIHCS